MARISAWEFSNAAEFDGERLYAEVMPEDGRAVRQGTLELTLTPARLHRGTVFSHGLPGRDPGAFALVLTHAGAVCLSCTEKDGAPLRIKTPDGFVGSGEQIQVTLSWGVGGRFVVVNTDRMGQYPGAPETGFVSPLPLRARCDLRGTHGFTFGAAAGGMAPFFHGKIHRATLSDTVDAPTVAPPKADVVRIEFGRQDRVTPRRVSTPLGPERPMPRILPEPARISGPASMRFATSEGDVSLVDLSVGTELLTRNGGFAPVRWVGRVELDHATLDRRADLRPVVLRKGAFGPKLPEADLYLGRDQRVLVPGAALAEDGDAADGFLPARVIHIGADLPEVETLSNTFICFFCDKTVTVQVNGIWMEVVNPFEEALNRHQQAWRKTMMSLFPGLRDKGGAALS
ncbi:MAG: Hint domain-containing protein [Pseudomonadota bacterium]